MSWRVARSLETLRKQLNERAPNRDIKSDGAIGDAEHASRNSDHNPWFVLAGQPLVTARDFTHDPVGGLDCNWLKAQLVRTRDPRIKYVIWNGRIWYRSSGDDVKYTGSNSHSHHLHVSVVAGPGADDPKLWDLGPAQTQPNKTPEGRFLAGLTDVEARTLYNRVMGFLRQRWYIKRPSDGALIEVAEGTKGAVPATALDTLDGNWIMTQLGDDEVKILSALRALSVGAVNVQDLARELAPLIPEGTTPDELADAVRSEFANYLGGKA